MPKNWLRAGPLQGGLFVGDGRDCTSGRESARARKRIGNRAGGLVGGRPIVRPSLGTGVAAKAAGSRTKSEEHASPERRAGHWRSLQRVPGRSCTPTRRALRIPCDAPKGLRTPEGPQANASEGSIGRSQNSLNSCSWRGHCMVQVGIRGAPRIMLKVLKSSNRMLLGPDRHIMARLLVPLRAPAERGQRWERKTI